MMTISLLEVFDNGFDDNCTDYEEPSIDETLAWSEEWAHELGLWGLPDPNGVTGSLDFSKPSLRSQPLSLDTHLEENQKATELRRFHLRSLQNFPDKRKEGNAIVDQMLRSRGISESLLAQFKQVLPYKIALLHRITAPTPFVQRVPVWLWKTDISAYKQVKNDKDLCCVFIRASSTFKEWKQELSQATCYELPEGKGVSDWEYLLTESANTERGRKNTGLIRSTRDWRQIANSIISKTEPYNAVVVYQRSELDKPYKPPLPLNKKLDIGMARLAEAIKDAKLRQTGSSLSTPLVNSEAISVPAVSEPHNRFSSPIVRSISTSKTRSGCNESTHERLRHATRNSYESIGQARSRTVAGPSNTVGDYPTYMQDGTSPTAIESEKENVAVAMFSHLDPDNDGIMPNSDEPSAENDSSSTQSRYVTVWLQHDGLVDGYFDMPKVDVASRPRKSVRAESWNETLFLVND